MKSDVYERITTKIVSDLEAGVRPWLKPWNAEHAAGRITRPLRGNGISYRGINILMLWGEAMAKGYTAPIWTTFKQAWEMDLHSSHTAKLCVISSKKISVLASLNHSWGEWGHDLKDSQRANLISDAAYRYTGTP